VKLEISGLSKTYPNGVQALKDVSLDIAPGMFGLLGPNGAGKSTLMRTLATLQEPDTGSVHLGEIDLLARPREVRRVLGYLPQEFGVYPRISAQAMLEHLAVLKGVPKNERRETVEALLRKTNLWEVRKSKLGTYSGGMKQRFGIAQALLGDPRLIIVDEPTAGLDPTERLRFHNLLSAIGENIVVILSTHIVDDVSDLCSSMAVISKGRVVLTSDPAAAVDRLRGRIWSRIVPRESLAAFQEEHDVISTHLRGGRNVVHVLADEAPDSEFDPVAGDLEDVYFSTLRQAGEQTVA